VRENDAGENRYQIFSIRDRFTVETDALSSRFPPVGDFVLFTVLITQGAAHEQLALPAATKPVITRDPKGTAVAQYVDRLDEVGLPLPVFADEKHFGSVDTDLTVLQIPKMKRPNGEKTHEP
jgi:hypothetical protein